jgi:hypothetical protein
VVKPAQLGTCAKHDCTGADISAAVSGTKPGLRDGLGRPIRRPRQEAAEALLFGLLRNGPLASREIKAVARQERIATRTLWRAKRAIGVRSTTDRYGIGANWRWYLPDG